MISDSLFNDGINIQEIPLRLSLHCTKHSDVFFNRCAGRQTKFTNIIAHINMHKYIHSTYIQDQIHTYRIQLLRDPSSGVEKGG